MINRSQKWLLFPVSRWKVFQVVCRRGHNARRRAEAHAGVGFHWVSAQRVRGLCTYWYVSTYVHLFMSSRHNHCINSTRRQRFFFLFLVVYYLSSSRHHLFFFFGLIFQKLGIKTRLTRACLTSSLLQNGNTFWKIRQTRPPTPTAEVGVVFLFFCYPSGIYLLHWFQRCKIICCCYH